LFLQSVLDGFRLLAFWHVWLGVLFYVIGFGVYLLILSRIVADNGQGGRELAGCLTNLIAGPVVQGVLTAIVVAFLLPILLGGENPLALSDISNFFWQIALAGIIGVVIAILVGLIPFVGRMLTDAPGVQTFIIGAVVFRLLAGPAVADILNRAGLTVEVYPSIWLTLAYMGIAVVFFYVATLLVALVAARREESAGGMLLVVVGPAMSVLGGLLALFMYSAYTANSLLRAVGR
jgi:hypothetical protein